MPVIYTLTDPRTGRVRYVGQALDVRERFRRHLRIRDGSHRANWITLLASNGAQPILSVVQEVSLEEKDDAERAWIAKLRAEGADLVNSTDGGEGRVGWKHSLDSRVKMSVGHRGKPSWNKGRTFSAESRAKMSAAAKRRASDPSFIETVSRRAWERNRGRTRPDHAAKLRSTIALKKAAAALAFLNQEMSVCPTRSTP